MAPSTSTGTLLGFEEELRPSPAFAMLYRGDLRLLLSVPGGGGGSAPMSDGTLPEAGGWNRFALLVPDLDITIKELRTKGASFRNDIVTGVGVKQILLQDPAGEPDRAVPTARRLPRAATAHHDLIPGTVERRASGGSPGQTETAGHDRRPAFRRERRAMTTKADFTAEEWALVLEAPPSAGIIVVTAQRGGTLRETLALAKAYAEARRLHGESELLDEIVRPSPNVTTLALPLGRRAQAARAAAPSRCHQSPGAEGVPTGGRGLPALHHQPGRQGGARAPRAWAGGGRR